MSRNVTLPVPRHTADDLERRLDQYREGSPVPTWAGTAAFLGVPRVMLDAYKAGQINSPEAARIAEMLQLHLTHVEAYLEGVLTREKGSPAGAQFALKAQMGWEDKVTVELSSKPQLSVIVSGELGRMLAGQIDDAEIIEDDDYGF